MLIDVQHNARHYELDMALLAERSPVLHTALSCESLPAASPIDITGFCNDAAGLTAVLHFCASGFVDVAVTDTVPAFEKWGCIRRHSSNIDEVLLATEPETEAKTFIKTLLHTAGSLICSSLSLQNSLFKGLQQHILTTALIEYGIVMRFQQQHEYMMQKWGSAGMVTGLQLTSVSVPSSKKTLVSELDLYSDREMKLEDIEGEFTVDVSVEYCAEVEQVTCELKVRGTGQRSSLYSVAVFDCDGSEHMLPLSSCGATLTLDSIDGPETFCDIELYRHSKYNKVFTKWPETDARQVAASDIYIVQWSFL
jgi:hypothetical protein